MSDFHVKKIILPSGKAVEIVYFHAEAEAEALPAPIDTIAADTDAEHTAGTETQRGLEHCPGCRSDLVYPVDWREAESDRWELELRCPNCEWTERSVHAQEHVEVFDEVLNAGTDVLIEALEKVSRENMEADIKRFVEALDNGLIEPFDF